MPDNVNHPSHYTQGGIECISAIKASMPPDGFQDYCPGFSAGKRTGKR